MKLNKIKQKINNCFTKLFISIFIFLFAGQNFVFAQDFKLDEPLGLYKKVYSADYTNNPQENIPESTAPTISTPIDSSIAQAPSDSQASVNSNEVFNPFEEITTSENNDAVINQKNVYFGNSDFYWFRRYAFKNTDSKKRYSSSITLPGNTIEIRYVDPLTNQWVLTSDLSKIGNVKTTLFINTDTNSAILGVPAVYKNLFTNNTLEIMPSEESPVSFSYENGNYVITFSFPQNSERIGEIWCLQSPNKLIDWSTQKYYNYLKVHDLSVERRWSWDGYYFKTPSNYVPTGENVLYRHPSNYTGASFIRHGDCPATKDLGFVMTYTCLKNQNEEGFWATGPESLWLKSDFDIGANFYDTRFSTDFAINLIFAYKKCSYKPFLDGAVKYGEYFLSHAQKNHYDAGEDGWLVEDYAPNASAEAHKRTHVSLNHQVNEMIFLYYLYNETKDSRFYDLAGKMLTGIDNTKYSWVLPDGNLNYALMYNGTANTMVDYPFLTYNDLFELKEILNGYGIKNITVNFLMESKKAYMDLKGITDYRKE